MRVVFFDARIALLMNAATRICIHLISRVMLAANRSLPFAQSRSGPGRAGAHEGDLGAASVAVSFGLSITRELPKNN
jgi:hypothetical protein